MKEFTLNEYQQNLKELTVYGYTVVKGLLSEDEVDYYKKETENLYNKHKDESYGGTVARDTKDKIIYNLQNKSKTLIDILLNDWCDNFYRDLLNDPYHRYLPETEINANLHYFNARSSGKALDLHIDSHIPYQGENPIIMQYVFFLEDSHADNGCTIVVPGSHQSGTFTDRDLKKVTELHAKAGDLVIWDSRLWHGTRENTSNESRWALVATVGMWWIKQTMDITGSMPQEIYDQLSVKQKAFMGFCAIPPKSELDRINTKCGYDFLKESVSDYN
jgi:ectoine hydroxylase-related dioxygenase (phytanoyl-CoA dioxygenase family)